MLKSLRSERKREICCCRCSREIWVVVVFVHSSSPSFFISSLRFSVSREIALGIVVIVMIKFDDDGSGERMRLKMVRRFYVFFYKKKSGLNLKLDL
jgi:hypothetical protein